MAQSKLDSARDGLRRAKELARLAKGLAQGAARDALHSAKSAREPSASHDLVETKKRAAMEAPQEEPPVVARLMVEIRSDGTRTIARGALQDELSGEQVAIEAKGNSPLELAGQLAKSLLTAPLSSGVVRSALSNSRRKKD